MNLREKKQLKKYRKSALMADINVVPYIDVMLVLLVIFMITAPMLTQGVRVDLPQAKSEAITSTHQEEPIIVSVNKLGQYFLNISGSPSTPIAPRALMVRIAAELELAKQAKQERNVLVKGDKGVEYGKVVYAMGLLKSAGASHVGLVTESVETVETLT